ncbi:MAG: glycosyltransferase family 4 protein [Actinomycetes bacterium]
MTTGSSHFSFDMAREYVRQGHQVMVVTTQPENTSASDNIDGIHIVRVPAKWVAPGKVSFNYRLPFCIRPSIFGRLNKIFKAFEPDVIHQNGQFFDLTLATTLVASRRKIPRVLTVHTPLTHTNTFARLLISTIDRLVLRPFANTGKSRIFGVDRFTMDMVQRRYKPKTPVGFIPATLDVHAFGAGDPSRIIERFGLVGKKVILSFGHVIPIRSRIPLIRALPEILRKIPNAQVVVVGEVYDTTFLKIAEELGVSSHITVVGRVPHVDVPDYLAAADIETHDLDIHGIGITTFEVMAAGVPIIASVDSNVFPGIDLGLWPKVRILSGLSTSQLSHEIVDLLNADSVQIKEMQIQQLDFITKNFSVEIVAEKYLSVFLELID